MDEISQLHDDLLVKVLSFLPTKVAVSTSILSKRWQFLWMWLPKLDYGDYSDSFCLSVPESERLRSFINLNLPLHKAPVIESLHLKFGRGSIKLEDIKHWVLIAVSRCIRELSLSLFCIEYCRTKLPSILYTCKSLVVLKLKGKILVDVPCMASLPSLKTLILRDVRYSDENFLHQLLTNCPVLEDLLVEQGQFNGLKTLSVIVPTLQRLTLTLKMSFENYLDVVVINTPCLKYFEFSDYGDRNSYSLDLNDMPKLEEADISSRGIEKFFRSITFVKRLSICVKANAKEALFPDGIVFNQLEHLKLSSWCSDWPKVLVRILKDSPKLRELEFYRIDVHRDSPWQKYLDCVPQCFLHLETFKWIGKYGSQEEIELVKYILRNACCLKIATILFKSSYRPEEKINIEKMKQELSLSFRASPTCQLVFS